jgi:hypothetical protein
MNMPFAVASLDSQTGIKKHYYFNRLLSEKLLSGDWSRVETNQGEGFY